MVQDSANPVWHQVWENALFHDNPWLHEFARNSAASHKVRTIHENQGTVVAEVQPSFGRLVSITLSLPRLSLEYCLERLGQLVLLEEPGLVDRLVQSSWSFLNTLEQIGIAPWPQGIQEVIVRVTPETGQMPCPCTLSALIEIGWLLELDPGLLLRMRGLVPDAMRQQLAETLQEKRKSAQSNVQEYVREQDDIEAEDAIRTDHFWGNPRALRTYTPSHNPEASPFMPATTMGTPQVESEEGQRLLARLLQELYAQGFRAADDEGLDKQ